MNKVRAQGPRLLSHQAVDVLDRCLVALEQGPVQICIVLFENDKADRRAALEDLRDTQNVGMEVQGAIRFRNRNPGCSPTRAGRVGGWFRGVHGALELDKAEFIANFLLERPAEAARTPPGCNKAFCRCAVCFLSHHTLISSHQQLEGQQASKKFNSA
jgi:hypothetical protein